MALTVEEVIRMLDDAYEDNSDDDLGIDCGAGESDYSFVLPACHKMHIDM